MAGLAGRGRCRPPRLGASALDDRGQRPFRLAHDGRGRPLCRRACCACPGPARSRARNARPSALASPADGQPVWDEDCDGDWLAWVKEHWARERRRGRCERELHGAKTSLTWEGDHRERLVEHDRAKVARYEALVRFDLSAQEMTPYLERRVCGIRGRYRLLGTGLGEASSASPRPISMRPDGHRGVGMTSVTGPCAARRRPLPVPKCCARRLGERHNQLGRSITDSRYQQ